jgi:hypothetical protein
MGAIYRSRINPITTTASSRRDVGAPHVVQKTSYKELRLTQSQHIQSNDKRVFYGPFSDNVRPFICDEAPPSRQSFVPQPRRWLTSANHEEDNIGFRLEKLAHEAKFLSSTRQIKDLPSFKILKGSDNQNLVLRQLRRKLELGRNEIAWFILLASVTGVDPLSEGERGSISHISAAWSRWLRNAEEEAATVDR